MKKIIFLFLIIIPISLFCTDKKKEDADNKQEKLNIDLIEAVKKGDFNLVETLIQGGAQTKDVLIPHEKGETTVALIEAVKHNHVNIIELLLALGSNPNAESVYYDQPIIYAVHNNNPEIVKLLINAGSELNFGGYDNRAGYHGPNPLFEAVAFNPKDDISKKNNLEIIEMLLQAGANPNIRVSFNILAVAARLNKEKEFKLLLKFGANPEEKDINDQNFFDYLSGSFLHGGLLEDEKIKQEKIKKYKKFIEEYEEYKKAASKNLKESLQKHMPKELIDIIASYVFKP